MAQRCNCVKKATNAKRRENVRGMRACRGTRTPRARARMSVKSVVADRLVPRWLRAETARDEKKKRRGGLRVELLMARNSGDFIALDFIFLTLIYHRED